MGKIRKFLLYCNLIKRQVRNNLAVFLSLLFHTIIVLLLLNSTIDHPTPKKTMTVTPISSKEIQKQINKDLQVVSAVDEEFHSIKPPDTNRRARINQKTPKETVAPKTDKFKNNDGLGRELKDSEKSISQKGKSKDVSKKGDGISANDDYINGAEIGPKTILNTQEYKYSNYYNRIKDQLVERWRPKIRKEIETIKRIAKIDKEKDLTVGAKTTYIEAKLDSGGNILSIVILKSSGIPEFDKAAETSFNESAPFPHPPNDLVRDGVFTIRWEFTVMVEEASMVEYKVTQHR